MATTLGLAQVKYMYVLIICLADTYTHIYIKTSLLLYIFLLLVELKVQQIKALLSTYYRSSLPLRFYLNSALKIRFIPEIR